MKKEYGDAIYECWASGGDSDNLDYDDVDELCSQGYSGYEAGAEIARQQQECESQPYIDKQREADIEAQEAMLEYHQGFDLKRLYHGIKELK